MAALRWIATVAMLGGLAACGGEREPGESNLTNSATAEPSGPILPVAEPPLGREQLLLAVARAASSFTSGGDQVAAQRELDGKPYELRLRFGCPGGRQVMPGGAFTGSFDAEERVLRLGAVPNVTSEDAVAAALAGPSSEGVEGFWIGRPWLLSSACPASPQSQPAAPAEEQPVAAKDSKPVTNAPAPSYAPRVGIAQFFTERDVRTRRRDSRGYEVTKALADDEQPSAQGYDLVLTGRLRRGADGRVIMCTGDAAAAPPPCLISATFDRVSIERADTGDMLAEWGGG